MKLLFGAMKLSQIPIKEILNVKIPKTCKGENVKILNTKIRRNGKHPKTKKSTCQKDATSFVRKAN
jgi:hypothetical protein